MSESLRAQISSIDINRARLREGKSIDTLIYLVSQQLTPAAVAVRYWSPAKIIFVYTSESEKLADNLVAWANKFCETKKLFCHNAYDKNWCTEMDFGTGNVVADITGGTKIMSLGLYQKAEKEGYHTAYYNDTEILDIKDSSSYDLPGNIITWHDLFTLNDIKYNPGRKEPAFADHLYKGVTNPDTARNLHTLFKKDPASKKKGDMRFVINENDNNFDENLRSWLQEAHKQKLVTVRSVEAKSNRWEIYTNPEQTKWMKGLYLELLLGRSFDYLEKNGDIRNASIGVDIKSNSDYKFTDLDGVFTWKNKIVFVSCKAGNIKEGKSGIDRLGEWTRRLGGRRAAAILIYDNQSKTQVRDVCKYAENLPNIGVISDWDKIRSPEKLGNNLIKMAGSPVGDI